MKYGEWADYVPDRNVNCHFGDHYYIGNSATCDNCGHFNAPLLNWARVEKAQREGRHHGTHYHLTLAAAEKCNKKTHDQIKCANEGGCMQHEASDKYLNDNSQRWLDEGY